MNRSGEDPLLIDLDKSAIINEDQNPPLIPAPNSRMVNPDNNPFDAVAEQTNLDPFDMVVQKAYNDGRMSDNNVYLDVRYDLISLNDSDEKNGSASKKTPNRKDNLETHNLVLSNNSLKINASANHEDSNGNSNSFFSPIISQNLLQVESRLSRNRHSGNSIECISDENSKKSIASMNISALSSLNCISENSNNEAENSSVFLGDNGFTSDKNIKDFVAARIQNVIKRTLNKSFAGFGQNRDQVFHDIAQSKSTAKSMSTDDGAVIGDTNGSKIYSDYSSKSYGSMNHGFLKTTGSINCDSILNEKQETPDNKIKTSTPFHKYKVNSSLFQSPPVEILREATRLSRSFSLGSTNCANVAENIEDLRSIKPKWETLDSSSDDDDDFSDDSLKSLRLNIRRSSLSTPPKRTPDSEALKKFKMRLSLVVTPDVTAEKLAVKPRSRSADRTISDSALKSLGTKAYPMNLHPVLPAAKLEDVKLRPKNHEPDVKAKRGPMKAFVPLKNMLRCKDMGSSKKSTSPTKKVRTKSPVPRSPNTKKSAIKPTASSTPKRFRKPLAENNAQDTPNSNLNEKNYQKLRRSNSYEIKNPTPDSKITYRSSSASRINGGIKPPTPVSKLPGLIQGSPNKAWEEHNTTPKKKMGIPTLRARQPLYSGKENINKYQFNL